MKKYLYFILLLVVVVNAQAQTPFVFEAGTPAKASEVNGNFESLDNEILSLSERLDALEANKCPVTDNGFRVTFSKKDGAVGLFVGPRTVLTKVPFVDFKNNNRYTIKYPGYVYKKAGLSYLADWIEFEAVDPSTFCPQFTISGYPSSSNFVNVTRKMPLRGDGTVNQITIQTLIYIQILVENTVIRFYFVENAPEQPGFQVPPDTYDFTSIIDTNFMVTPAANVQFIDDMIDYIVIQPVQ